MWYNIYYKQGVRRMAKNKKTMPKSRKILWCVLGTIFLILAASSIAIPIVIDNQSKQTPKSNSSTGNYVQSNTTSTDIVDQVCLSNANALGPTEDELSNASLVITSTQKTIQMYDAELKCYEGTDTSIYSNTIAEIKSKKAELEQLLSAYPGASTQTYTYTESATTTTTPTYNVSDYIPTTAPTPTCADYHAQYYAEYQSQLSSTNSHYASAINSAAASCSSQHGSFGGCPQKTSLEQQWQVAVAQLKNSYKSNMSSAGCDSSAYVDF